MFSQNRVLRPEERDRHVAQGLLYLFRLCQSQQNTCIRFKDVIHVLGRLWLVAGLAFLMGAGLGSASPAASPIISWTSFLLAIMAYEGPKMRQR